MEDLEPKIKNCLLLLQSIDEKESPTLYKREFRKFVILVYPYIQVKNKEHYGFEIAVTIEDCSKNYKPTKGNFLVYVNSALKQNLAHSKGDELLDEHTKGMHLQDTNKRKYKKYKKSQGRDIESPEFNEKFEKIIEDGKRIEHNCKTQYSIYQQEDGKEHDILEETSSSEKSCLDKIIAQEDAQTVITKISNAFDSCRKDQQPILKVLLTSCFSLLIKCEIPECCSYFQNQPFFDNETYQECIKNNKEMTHRAIANKFSRCEESISRTWNNFIEKLDIKREE